MSISLPCLETNVRTRVTTQTKMVRPIVLHARQPTGKADKRDFTESCTDAWAVLSEYTIALKGPHGKSLLANAALRA